MRKSILLKVILLILLFVFIPMSILFFYQNPGESIPAILPINADQEPLNQETWEVFNPKTKEMNSVSIEDYLKGTLASEMPLYFNEEALKAQVVASHTYALHILQENGRLLSDSNTCQAFSTKEDLKNKYGDQFSDVWEKLTKIVDEVKNEVLTYQNKPIMAVYHAMSSGITESSENVWGKNIPYLQSVNSNFDENQKNYLSVITLPAEEVKMKLNTQYPDLLLTENPENWFYDISYDSSGYVMQIKVGDTEMSGSKLRSIFNLKSSDFAIDFHPENNSFTFTCKGSGHGVGMSQYGANYLAQQGYSYAEILNYYYKNTNLIKIS